MKARGAQGLARNGCAARHQQHVEATLGQRARQSRGATQMADTQQMLHVKEDTRAHGAPFRGTSRRSTATLPSVRAVKKWTQRQSSLCGGRPVMSQPVA